MSRVVKRRRPLLRLFTAMALLFAGGVALLWAKTRLFPDVAAEASSAYARREWGRAATLARRRLKEAPDDPRALRLAARAAARQDQDQTAITLYRRLAAGSRDAEDFTLLGKSLFRTGQVDGAYEAYRTALEKDPDQPEALSALIALYVRNDRLHAAQPLAERLARQPAWEALAQMLLGSIHVSAHDPVDAARALQRGLQLDPQARASSPVSVSSFQKLLAVSFLQAGQPAEARAALEALLGSGPDPQASWLLSRCFIQERDWSRAAAVLQQHPSYRAEHPLEPEPAPYVGEARCAECHREQSAAVLASRHATTFARARELGSLPLTKDPLPDPGNPRVKHDLKRDGDSLIVETRKDDRVLRAVVDYAFGSRDHFTTFVGRDDRGGSVMVRMSHYESSRGTGWDIATGLPLEPAVDEDYLGAGMFPGDGVRRCLHCHTTNFRAILHGTGPEAADQSIGCERCHGPGGHHVAAVAAGFSDLAIVNPGAASPAACGEVCAVCHGAHQPQGLDFPQTDTRWLRFQSLTLTWSRCYTESDGTLGCVTCHDPHRNAETSAARNEAKCLACHAPVPSSKSARPSPSPASSRSGAPPGDRPAAEAVKRCPVNPTRGCIECHMPRIWVQSTHSFKTDHFIRVRDQSPVETRAPAVH